MIPDNPRSIARIFAFVFLLVVFVNLLQACLVIHLARADSQGAPLPGVAVVRLASCKTAPANAKPMFDDWARVEADVLSIQTLCAEVYPDYEVRHFDTSVIPNDPSQSQQYSLDRMSVRPAWDRARGDGVVIAVLDTGMDFSHPDLQGKYVNRGRDFINNDHDASDDHGHGTHVSGIAAAATGNGQGIAGVGYNARVLPVKVLGANGSGSMGLLADAIHWASQQSGVRVINMSLGCECPGLPYIDAAVANARSRGVVVIAAAGNSNTNIPHYPASAPGVIGVGASNFNDTRAYFSNFGVNARVAAPGQEVLSTIRGGGYAAWNGTSMAAPNASGVAALIWSACSACSVGEVERRLLDGDDIGNLQIGRRVNALKAVQPSAGPTLTPLPTPNYPTATPNPDQDADAQLVTIINQERAARGLPPFQAHSALTTIARQHNYAMDACADLHGWGPTCFSHQVPGEPDPFQRIRHAGFNTGSEVIARGYNSPRAAVNGWLESSGHRAIILGSYTFIGCAFDDLAGGNYQGRLFTCNVASGGQAQPTVIVPPTRAPAPSPTSANGLPRGWIMWVALPQATGYTAYDYDTASFALVDAVYRQVCVGLAGQGARCEWRRK